ncbi:DUF1835 domain-containing protein [Aestuariispira insulae]|uniref:Uncharacterized protein DUF1835 n=1 Tax=Aestuariispira insulae TaxID=1461337 RepID=A0A3D9HJK0_9PROT|nr:DUF1835 domain-containing protein [Aestuariispira insulae]RED49670.1 uncharacterized protein DUF1835 [Aestuariispira insulae]
MRQLHLRCGSDIAERLFEAGFEGDYLEWSDPVCQGPVPHVSSHRTYLKIRALFISEAWGEDFEETYTKLDYQYRALEKLDDYDRIILWFEHDLYDQSVLINLLSRLQGRPSILNRLYLITTDRFEGLDRFMGFGQLAPEQLACFKGREIPVTRAMAEEASRFWDAYRRDNPQEIARLATNGGVEGLPYINGAMIRFLQDYPWVVNGLSLTAQLALKALKRGAGTPGEIFRELTLTLDPQPFLGDVMFWPFLSELSAAPKPAITAFEGIREPIALTDYGRALLKGEADWILDNGVEHWMGGVNLGEGRALWRWDEAACTLRQVDV